MYKRLYFSIRGCKPELLYIIFCYRRAFNAFLTFHQYRHLTGQKIFIFQGSQRLESLRVDIFYIIRTNSKNLPHQNFLINFFLSLWISKFNIFKNIKNHPLFKRRHFSFGKMFIMSQDGSKVEFLLDTLA